MAVLVRCKFCRCDQSVHNRVCVRCGRSLNRDREYVVVIKQPDGKWIKRVCGNSLETARIIEGKLKSQIREDKYLDRRKPAITLDEAWQQYFNWLKVNRKSWKRDLSRYNVHLKDRFGSVKLDRITPFEIEKLKTEMKERGYASQTIKHVLALMRRIFNSAIRWELYDGTNPIKKVAMPAVDNTVTEQLTFEQLRHLLTAIDTYGERQRESANLIKFMLFTGLRRGEVFKLKWEDVDLKNGWITIRDPKGGKSEILPLNRYALAVLTSQLEHKQSDYVFPGRKGKIRSNVTRAWKHIKTLAGLPDNFRLHGLRHAFGSFLASSGKVDIYVLQKLMTHKSSKMTQRYAHLAERRLKEAARVMDEIVEQALKTEERNNFPAQTD